jgi:hypothetical protein
MARGERLGKGFRARLFPVRLVFFLPKREDLLCFLCFRAHAEGFDSLTTGQWGWGLYEDCENRPRAIRRRAAVEYRKPYTRRGCMPSVSGSFVKEIPT